MDKVTELAAEYHTIQAELQAQHLPRRRITRRHKVAQLRQLRILRGIAAIDPSRLHEALDPLDN